MMSVESIGTSPRKILALVVYLAATVDYSGKIPTEQQFIHKQVYKLQKVVPEVFDVFVFSEWYPFKWSYEVDQGLQSLMADDYISTPNPAFRYYVVKTDKIEEDIIKNLPEDIVNKIKQGFDKIKEDIVKDKRSFDEL